MQGLLHDGALRLGLFRDWAGTLALVALLALGFASYTSMQSERQALRLLFVGNSLTYVGDLPAVFDALVAANGKAVRSDMIAMGGATLTDRVLDGAVARALSAEKYNHVVLQERGGDFICAFAPESCERAIESFGALVALARNHGSAPILLGTYQFEPSHLPKLFAPSLQPPRKARCLT